MNNNTKKDSQTKKSKSASSSSSKKEVHLGNGVAEKVINQINDEITNIALSLLEQLTNYFKDKIHNLPNKIKDSKKAKESKKEKETIETLISILKDPENNKEIIDIISLFAEELYSKQLYEQNLISENQIGVPLDMLTSSFQNEAYQKGIYIGLMLALTTLLENGASKDLLNNIWNLQSYCLLKYENSDEMCDELNLKLKLGKEKAKVAMNKSNIQEQDAGETQKESSNSKGVEEKKPVADGSAESSDNNMRSK